MLINNYTRWAKSRYTIYYILYTYFWPTLFIHKHRKYTSNGHIHKQSVQ